MYSSWQSFTQALLVDSPLLSYIDVRHSNFLPPKLTVGEARDLGWRYTCSEELAPLRDESAKLASRRLRELAHKAIQQEQPVKPEAPIREAEHIAAESSDSSKTHPTRGEEMVTRKTLSVSWFIPDACQTAPQQPPQRRGQTPPVHPPPPPPARPRKRPWAIE